MLTLEPFVPGHLAAFVPGEPEREANAGIDLPVAMAEHPTVTVLRDGIPHAFLGIRPYLGRPHVWSMWSEDARREPFGLSRFLRLHAGWLLEMYGAPDAEVVTTNPRECRLAQWLGMEGKACPS